jgi:hypothetical protein
MGAARYVTTRAANLIVVRDRGDDPDALFRVVYGLPVELQLAIAAATLARTLPIMEQRAAGLEVSPTRLALWIEGDVTSEPARHDPFDMPRRIFGIAREAFLDACEHRADPAALTSQVAHATREAIRARALAVWATDDPGAATLPVDERPEETSPFRSPVYRAVEEREWCWLVEWLEQHGIREQPDPDPGACESDLARWRAVEYTWLGSTRDADA